MILEGLAVGVEAAEIGGDIHKDSKGKTKGKTEGREIGGLL